MTPDNTPASVDVGQADEELHDAISDIVQPIHWETWKAALFCNEAEWPDDDEQQFIARSVDDIAVLEHWDANGSPIIDALVKLVKDRLAFQQPGGEAGGMICAQIEMGHGLVDVGQIHWQGRSGVLFAPRDQHVPIGEDGTVKGDYWPKPSDVVIWVDDPRGADVVISNFATLASAVPAAFAPHGHLARYLKGKNTACWVYGSPTADDNEPLYAHPPAPAPDAALREALEEATDEWHRHFYPKPDDFIECGCLSPVRSLALADRLRELANAIQGNAPTDDPRPHVGGATPSQRQGEGLNG